MTAKDIYIMFSPGTRVEVAGCMSYKKYDYRGKVGTVVTNQYGAYGKIIVKLDGERNPYSGTGNFYFKPRELTLVNESNTDILEENTMQNVVNYFNIVKIKYLDSAYTTKHDYANFDTSLKVGDLCVVKSLNHGLGLARVTEVIDRNDIKTSREIVAKVDTEHYDSRVESRKQAAELKALMEERARQLQDIALYQMLAEKDLHMQDLLNRFNSLPQY